MGRWVHKAAISTLMLTSCAVAAAQESAPPAAPAAAPEPPATVVNAPTPSNASEVASVKSTNGKVLHNRASVYGPAAKDQRLQVGDRLVVLEGGVIVVRFDSGCEQTIDQATVYTVPSTPPCVAGAADRGLRSPVQSTGATTAATTDDYLKWGLIGLGLITPIIVLSSSDAGKPISP